MKKKHQNINQPNDTPKQEEQKLENAIVTAEATKKCPYCESDLPEKIAFCLYCMKPLTVKATQMPMTTQQENNSNRFQKTSTKILVGVGALLTVAVIVIATSIITASILSRQSTSVPDFPLHQPEISDGNHVTDGIIEPAPTPLPTPSYNTEPTPQHTEQPEVHLPIEEYVPNITPPNDGARRGQRPSNPEISLERAIEIAYADIAARGINASFHSSSGMSWEMGQWVWELLFSTQGEMMPFIEYYINVDNGNIVKFEWDD